MKGTDMYQGVKIVVGETPALYWGVWRIDPSLCVGFISFPQIYVFAGLFLME